MASSALMVEKKIQKKPVIIYLVPPKVIHADAGEFMALVQRLTGKSADSPPSSPSPDAKVLKPCKGSVISKARHRQFPVRVEARRALSQPSSEDQYNGMPHSSYLSEFVGHHHHHHHEDVPVASPHGNWLLPSEYSVESHNFIDIFQ